MVLVYDEQGGIFLIKSTPEVSSDCKFKTFSLSSKIILFSLVLSLRRKSLVVGAILQWGVVSFHGVAHNLKANKYFCQSTKYIIITGNHWGCGQENKDVLGGLCKLGELGASEPNA